MKKTVLAILLLTAVGCTDARRAKIGAYGDPGDIKQYSGGVLIGHYCSTGRILSEESSDGYFFKDSKTGVLHQVSGDVQITYNVCEVK